MIMTEHPPDPTITNPQPEPRENGHPPSPPLPPDVVESDPKHSRKREREVSLEPATPKAEVTDVDPGSQEPKDRRTPAKKNRIQLDITEEEEDVVLGARTPPSSHTPPLSMSPPHEVKVRQISQGVEEITWQSPVKAKVANHVAEDDLVSATEADDDVGDPLATELLAPVNTTTIDGVVPPDSADSLQGSVMESREEDLEAGPSPSNAVASPACRPDSDSDGMEKEKGLKRKFGARAISVVQRDFAAEPMKRQRDDPDKDDNPRETKRPSPPPEPESSSSKGSSPVFKSLQPINRDSGTEPLKRQRDDSDKDDNPREAKRPSPPPEPESSPSKESDSTLKFSGFMAYASPTSPFAALKGRNIFKKSPTISPSLPPSSLSSAPFPTLTSVTSGSSTSTIHATRISQKAEPTADSAGFDLPLSSRRSYPSILRSRSPPFGSASSSQTRGSKSPTRRGSPANVNAFSSYATGGVQGFHATKRARATSPSGGSSQSSLERKPGLNILNSNDDGDSEVEGEEEKAVSFGEKLRAGRDDENEGNSDEDKKLVLTEQEVTTGEEDEETIYQVRGKLFSLSSQSQWKERGTGTLRLNARRFDGSGARLVMRKEAVYTLLLNFTLFRGMRCFLAQDPRYLRFSIIEDGTTTHYNLRVASAKVAQELLDEINANIPTT